MRRSQLLTDKSKQHLASLVAAVDAAETADVPWRDQINVHFLRNFTIEPVEPYLKFHLLREDIRPQITYGGYDTMSQEILDPESSINRHRPEIIVLSLLLEYLDNDCLDEAWTANQALGRLDDLMTLVLNNTTSLIICNTLLAPVDLLFTDSPSADRDREIRKLNDRIGDLANQHPHRIRLTDWEHQVSDLGVEKAIDKRFWKMSQAPFAADFLDRIAIDIVSNVRTLKGQAKKCLVLDCDNTLWGGVVGEDGIDGISLHPDQSPGSAFYELQRSVVELHAQGVIIALCSKNNEEDVWEVLENHPHCLLKQSHLVSWRIDWNNKADNIVSLVRELNIGIDSIVFLDDNPRECALINDLLPEVTVIQVPTDLENYGNILSKGGLFASLTQSDEDRRRTQMYQDAVQRQQEESRFSDLSEYLTSLGTIIEIARPAEADIARVAQLTQRTNQFNLTTRRYSEADIREFMDDKNAAVYSMKVHDRYGDMGLTGVLVAIREGTTGIVDTFLLSCRVLGRQLEFAFVDQCMQIMEELWHVDAWKAEFIPTRKNAQTSGFWDQVGLKLASEESGHRRYLSAVASRPSEYINLMKIHLE